MLYINDGLSGLSCDVVMFATDVEIWREIESATDDESLQNDISRLPTWSEGGLIKFNTDIFVVCRLHLRK